MPPASVFLI